MGASEPEPQPQARQADAEAGFNMNHYLYMPRAKPLRRRKPVKAPGERWLSLAQSKEVTELLWHTPAAKMLGVPPQVLSQWRRQGKIAARPVGARELRYLYRREDVEALRDSPEVSEQRRGRKPG